MPKSKIMAKFLEINKRKIDNVEMEKMLTQVHMV